MTASGCWARQAKLLAPSESWLKADEKSYRTRQEWAKWDFGCTVPCTCSAVVLNLIIFQRNKLSSFCKGRRFVNRLTPNDSYMGRTAPLTSKRCILYIYSTNVGTEYFKHALYSPFFPLQNAICFIMLTCLVPVLFTFYIQNVLKLKK